ncbi:MAG TPA: SRPBCC family protein [Acidimicrobiales bacterium]|nr:SRPBCC family protein [Acidimicrobiales bacterium]
MTRRYEFEASARTSAPVDVVWPLVGEVARWKEWAWMTRTSLLREGDPPPDGVGALRRFAVGPGGSQEEVVAWDPPRHLGYVAVRGLPVRYYRADVHLDDDGGGTLVTWRCELEPLVPGTGPALRFALRRMVRGFAVRVCRYAERGATGSA